MKTNDEFFLENKSIAAATDLEQTDDVALAISEKRLPAAAAFPLEAFLEISFTHHMEILHKTKELDERRFYIRECVAEYIRSHYEHAVTNEQWEHFFRADVYRL